MKIKEQIWNLKPSRPIGDMPAFHCYLVKDQEGLTLVDTSMAGRTEDILREIRKLGQNPRDLRKILLTHSDAENIGNAAMLQQLTGCRVYASGEEIRLIRGEITRNPVKERKYGSRPPLPTLTELPVEGVDEYQVIPTPGHTPGHVCYVYRKVLFAGDACTVKNGELGGPETDVAFCDNASLARRSWQEIRPEEYDYICTSHGEGCGYVKMEKGD